MDKSRGKMTPVSGLILLISLSSAVIQEIRSSLALKLLFKLLKLLFVDEFKVFI